MSKSRRIPIEDWGEVLGEMAFEIKALRSELAELKAGQKVADVPTSTKIPAKDVYTGPGRLMSKPTLYSHIRAGKITLFKVGSRSYLDRGELDQLFRKSQIKK